MFFANDSVLAARLFSISVAVVIAAIVIAVMLAANNPAFSSDVQPIVSTSKLAMAGPITATVSGTTANAVPQKA